MRVVKNGLSEDLDWEDIALSHEVTVAEAKTLRPFNDRMVSSALFMFRRFVAGLPAGTSVTFQTMEEFLKTNFREYLWDYNVTSYDDCLPACMAEATILFRIGWLEPVRPLFDAEGYQLHDNYTRTAKPSTLHQEATAPHKLTKAEAKAAARAREIAGYEVKNAAEERLVSAAIRTVRPDMEIAYMCGELPRWFSRLLRDSRSSTWSEISKHIFYGNDLFKSLEDGEVKDLVYDEAYLAAFADTFPKSLTKALARHERLTRPAD